MKKIYLLALLIGLVAFTGCSEDDLVKPTPSPEAPAGTQGVYFPASNKSAFELMPVDPTEFVLTIARTESNGAIDVPINVEVNDDNVFVVPASVSFADGETEKTFKVTFPSAAEGITYDLKLNVEGDEFVNPYVSGLSYVKTNATRVKWVAVEDPMVYIDGTVNAFFGAPILPMYVYAEKAKLGDATRYRFKNAYKVPTTVDEDGIYDGYPSNDPGDFLDGDYYTIIEIGGDKGGANEVFMFAGDTGMDWGYGVFNIGSVYSNASQNKDSYPLGTIKGDVITFPASSLYTSMKDYDNAAKRVAGDPTIIYLTKEAYIAANLKIESFNDIEYEEVAVDEGVFKSEVQSDAPWDQVMLKAIDIDEENDASEYKNLFYLPNLYEEDFGLAFYYSAEAGVSLPNNQPTGLKALGRDVFVSMSRDIKSEYIVGSEEGYNENLEEDEEGYNEDGGKDRYVFGLKFHYKDGTNLGDYKEVFLVSNEEEITPVINAKRSNAHSLKIQAKVSPKKMKKNVQGAVIL